MNTPPQSKKQPKAKNGNRKSDKPRSKKREGPPRPKRPPQRPLSQVDRAETGKIQRLIAEDHLAMDNAQAAAAAALMPEMYEARGPRGLTTTSVASASNTTGFSFNTTAQNMLWFAIQSLDASYPIFHYCWSSGGQSVAPSVGWTSISGPVIVTALQSFASSIAVMGCSVTFTPTGSTLQQAGTVRMGFFPSLAAAGQSSGVTPGAWITVAMMSNSNKTYKAGVTEAFFACPPPGQTQSDLDGLFNLGTTLPGGINIDSPIVVGVIDGGNYTPSFNVTVTSRVEFEVKNNNRAFIDQRSVVCDLGTYANALTGAHKVHRELTLGRVTDRMVAFKRWAAGRRFPESDIKDTNAGSNDVIATIEGRLHGSADFMVEEAAIEEEKTMFDRVLKAGSKAIKQTANIMHKAACQSDMGGVLDKLGVCDDFDKVSFNDAPMLHYNPY